MGIVPVSPTPLDTWSPTMTMEQQVLLAFLPALLVGMVMMFVWMAYKEVSKFNKAACLCGHGRKTHDAGSCQSCMCRVFIENPRL